MKKFTVRKATGAHGNKLEFYTGGCLRDDCITVSDKDCQIERTYMIGKVQELDDFKMVEIKTFAQVKRAWTEGTVWF